MQKIDLADVSQMLEEIRPDTDFSASGNFAEDGLLDSFDIVSLVSMIDEKYGVDIDGRDILPEHFASIETIAALVEKTLSKGRPR